MSGECFSNWEHIPPCTLKHLGTKMCGAQVQRGFECHRYLSWNSLMKHNEAQSGSLCLCQPPKPCVSVCLDGIARPGLTDCRGLRPSVEQTRTPLICFASLLNYDIRNYLRCWGCLDSIRRLPRLMCMVNIMAGTSWASNGNSFAQAFG